MKSKPESYLLKCQSPQGTFWIEGNQKGLLNIYFPGEKIKRVDRRSIPTSAKRVLEKAAQYLQKALKGKPCRRPLIQWESFSSFKKKVLKALSRIPRGKVVTYAELARKAGCPKAVRAVGSVMRKNPLPLFLPCHRVVRSGGILGNYSKGIQWKQTLLTGEGVSLRSKNGLLRIK